MHSLIYHLNNFNIILLLISVFLIIASKIDFNSENSKGSSNLFFENRTIIDKDPANTKKISMSRSYLIGLSQTTALRNDKRRNVRMFFFRFSSVVRTRNFTKIFQCPKNCAIHHSSLLHNGRFIYRILLFSWFVIVISIEIDLFERDMTEKIISRFLPHRKAWMQNQVFTLFNKSA